MLHYVAESPAHEAVMKEPQTKMPPLRRMVCCRSMPAVWSTPDERGESCPTGRRTARRRALANVASTVWPPHPTKEGTCLILSRPRQNRTSQHLLLW